MKKIFSLIAITLILVGCSLFSKKVEVKYEVTCTAIPNLVDIQTITAGDFCNFYDQSTPWIYTCESKTRSGNSAYIIAYNLQNHGTVTATIYIDDELLDEDTCSEAYGGACAYGTIE